MPRSDDDLAHFAQQRKTMDAVADAWKKSDLLIKAQDHEVDRLKATIRQVLSTNLFACCGYLELTQLDLLSSRACREHETELVALRQEVERAKAAAPATVTFGVKRDDAAVLRKEVERLRARNLMLEEQLADEQSGA